VRILYDHQVFSLQNAGGASRYFYELMKFLTTVPDAQTDLLLGISGTVYPFARAGFVKPARVTVFREWLPPGTLRYIVNEAWSNSIAPFRGGSGCLPLDPVHAECLQCERGSVVATHHDCTHERFPQMLFPDAGKIICGKEATFSQGRRDYLRLRVHPPGLAAFLQPGCEEDTRDPSRTDSASTRCRGRGRDCGSRCGATTFSMLE
jgi:hypothetical protein